MTQKIDPLLIDVPMPILTPRLRIEPVSDTTAAELLAAITESKESLREWMEWVHKPDAFELDARVMWLRKGQAQWITRENLFMQAFERLTGRLVGGTGFHGIDWSVPSFEIGYWVRSSAQGQGYATELSVGLLRYAFQALNANRISIFCTDGNIQSQRVIEKTGIPFEGLRRNDSRKPDGTLSDTRIYAATDIAQVPVMKVEW